MCGCSTTNYRRISTANGDAAATKSKHLPQDKKGLDIEPSQPAEDVTMQRGSSKANRPSCDPTTRLKRYARRGTSDLDILIDGRSITALVHIRADYSVISGTFAVKLKKVRTA